MASTRPTCIGVGTVTLGGILGSSCKYDDSHVGGMEFQCYVCWALGSLIIMVSFCDVIRLRF